MIGFENTGITFKHNGKDVTGEVSGVPGRIMQYKSTDPEFLKVQPSGFIVIPYYSLTDSTISTPIGEFINGLLEEIAIIWDRMLSEGEK